eukprot:PhF_6_TR20481/c0_g1_i1/m.29482
MFFRRSQWLLSSIPSQSRAYTVKWLTNLRLFTKCFPTSSFIPRESISMKASKRFLSIDPTVFDNTAECMQYCELAHYFEIPANHEKIVQALEWAEKNVLKFSVRDLGSVFRLCPYKRTLGLTIVSQCKKFPHQLSPVQVEIIMSYAQKFGYPIDSIAEEFSTQIILNKHKLSPESAARLLMAYISLNNKKSTYPVLNALEDVVVTSITSVPPFLLYQLCVSLIDNRRMRPAFVSALLTALDSQAFSERNHKRLLSVVMPLTTSSKSKAVENIEDLDLGRTADAFLVLSSKSFTKWTPRDVELLCSAVKRLRVLCKEPTVQVKQELHSWSRSLNRIHRMFAWKSMSKVIKKDKQKKTAVLSPSQDLKCLDSDLLTVVGKKIFTILSENIESVPKYLLARCCRLYLNIHQKTADQKLCSDALDMCSSEFLKYEDNESSVNPYVNVEIIRTFCDHPRGHEIITLHLSRLIPLALAMSLRHLEQLLFALSQMDNTILKSRSSSIDTLSERCLVLMQSMKEPTLINIESFLKIVGHLGVMEIRHPELLKEGQKVLSLAVESRKVNDSCLCYACYGFAVHNIKLVEQFRAVGVRLLANKNKAEPAAVGHLLFSLAAVSINVPTIVAGFLPTIRVMVHQYNAQSVYHVLFALNVFQAHTALVSALVDRYLEVCTSVPPQALVKFIDIVHNQNVVQDEGWMILISALEQHVQRLTNREVFTLYVSLISVPCAKPFLQSHINNTLKIEELDGHQIFGYVKASLQTNCDIDDILTTRLVTVPPLPESLEVQGVAEMFQQLHKLKLRHTPFGLSVQDWLLKAKGKGLLLPSHLLLSLLSKG